MAIPSHQQCHGKPSSHLCDDVAASSDGRPCEEHPLGFLEAAARHPKAMAWSAFFSIGVISAAFDQQLVGSLYSSPQFRRDFGYEFKGESALGMGSPVGQVAGALLAAYSMERYGRKRVFAACSVAMAGLVLMQFLARSIGLLVAGELLAGLVLGVFVVIAPTYSSEVCPTAVRGHMTSCIEFCFVLGQLVANGVTAGTQRLPNHWAYSLPFCLQWLWVAITLSGLVFAPESPWWLVRRARYDDARDALSRLASSDDDVATTLRFIVETNQLELEQEAGSTYRDCFASVNRTRTEISAGVYCAQVLSGIYLINYGTFFFQQAGLPTDQAFNMSVGFLAVGLLGVVFSWFLLVRLGRRSLFVGGLAILCGLQLVIGILDCVPGRPSGIIWSESALMLAWNLLYNMTIGPVCFILLSECSATRVRSKTIALATAAQGLMGIVMTVAIPYMINSAQANMQGKLGFFFGGLAGLCLAWAYVRVPETKDRTFEELDILFDRRVPARRFKDSRIHAERL